MLPLIAPQDRILNLPEANLRNNFSKNLSKQPEEKKPQNKVTDPYSHISDFASRLDKVTSSKAYSMLRPELRQKFDDAMFEKTVRLQKKVGQHEPAREDWNRLSNKQRVDYLKSIKPEPSALTLNEKATAFETRAAQSTFTMASGALKLAHGLMTSQASPTGFFPEQAYKSFEGFVDHIKDYYDSQWNNMETRVNSQLAGKIWSGAGYITPIMLSLGQGSPASLLGDVTKTAPKAYEVAGLISRYGGITKVLKNPNLSGALGRTVLHAAHGAMDGYLYAKVTADPDVVGAAKTFAAFEAGGPAIRVLANKTFAKLGSIFGADVVKASMGKTIEDLSKIEKAEASTDPIIRKLDETNAKILNDTTEEKFGKGKMYQFLSKDQKIQVNAIVSQRMVEGFSNPAAYDEVGTTMEHVQQEKMAASKNPEVAQIQQGLDKLSQQAGNAPDKSAVKAIQNQAKVDYLKPIQPKMLPSMGSKKRIVPGAASKYSPEFTEETWLHGLSMNPIIEDPKDRQVVNYILATRGRIRDKKLADKIISSFKSEFPTEEEQIGRIEGTKEHIHKLFVTGHLDDPEHVFRSGNYMADDLRDKYDMPKTEWQDELDEEFDVVMKSKRKK